MPRVYTCVECGEHYEDYDAVENELCFACRPRHVYCHECSKAGGADRPVYHQPPVCEPEPKQEVPSNA